MNKNELVFEVAMRLGLSQRAAREAVDAVFETIKRSVVLGEKVAIPDFGTFERRLRAPRTARNPRTGERVKVPATRVAAFRPGTDFRSRVAGTRATTARPGATRTR